jgi:uncharacterized membrane protein
MMTLFHDLVHFQAHGGASGSGLIGGIASLLEFIEGLGGKTPPEMFSAIFPGIASMDNIHPLLVHFPIAFFFGFFALECLGLWKNKDQWRYVASCLLYLGTLAAIFAVAAGFIAADSVEHDDVVHGIMERHEHIGVYVLTLSMFLVMWRRWRWGQFSKAANSFFIGLSALLCVLVAFGADLGGLMVYGHGVNVKRPLENTVPAEGRGVIGEVAPHDHGHHHHHDHGGHDH